MNSTPEGLPVRLSTTEIPDGSAAAGDATATAPARARVTSPTRPIFPAEKRANAMVVVEVDPVSWTPICLSFGVHDVKEATIHPALMRRSSVGRWSSWYGMGCTAEGNTPERVSDE